MNAFNWSMSNQPKPAPDQEPQAAVPIIGARTANERVVEHTDDLPDFARKLYDEVRMVPSLKHRLCPIDVSTEGAPKQFAIVLMADELNTDVTDALIADLQTKGWRHADEGCYIASNSVMVELARDSINNHRRNKGTAAGKKEDSALWNLFEGAVVFALDTEASDIHIEIDHTVPHSQIKFRIDGRLTEPREFQMETLKLLDMVAYLYNVHSNTGSENTFNENQAQQCQIATTIKGVRVQFRWASNKTAVGTKVVMRVIRHASQQGIRSLTELGYLPSQVDVWRRAISRLGGGTLIAGVVGSGKSTTMVTVMSMLPKWMAKYTVEDPVETLIPGTAQFSVSRSLNGQGADPFLAVKRQTKRMDPDAVFIGEIRDHESASLFRDIAESGHRALSTVHAPSAIDMITLRLVSDELGIPRDVIATPGFINLLVYQALVPKLCTCCRKSATKVYDNAYLDRIERLFGIDRSKVKAQDVEGCENCRRYGLPELNGSKGRVVVAEMIEPTTKMLLLFRDSRNLELKRHIRTLRTARFDEPDSTGKSALEVAMYHVAQGTVDPKEVELKFGSFEQYETEHEGDILPTGATAKAPKPTVRGFALRARRAP